MVLAIGEFAYNNAVNKSIGKSPFEVVHGIVPRLPIDLVPLRIDSWPVESVETFAKHIHDVHANVQ